MFARQAAIRATCLDYSFEAAAPACGDQSQRVRESELLIRDERCLPTSNEIASLPRVIYPAAHGFHYIPTYREEATTTT